ncbi:hypothetical protein BMS3Abin11_01553 [bacterium BMS3Abin11]|nr:hypothetical protein BMS3Abin11_01553 [bacterium BMS3Abin11]
MKVDALVKETIEQGFRLWRDGGNVRFRGDIEMPPEQINDLREHKLELLAYLKLRDIAGKLDWHLSDLLDWYSDDLIEISHMEMDVVGFVVRDYIHNIDLCRGEGYQPLGELIQVCAA